jgi:hypothetical protein
MPRDEDAAARPRFQEVLVDELQVGRGHGVAAEAEQAGQLARRRQGGTGRQAAVEHGVHDRQPHLRLQRQRGLVAQLEELRPLDRARVLHDVCGRESIGAAPSGSAESPHLALPRATGAPYAVRPGWPSPAPFPLP